MTSAAMTAHLFDFGGIPRLVIRPQDINRLVDQGGCDVAPLQQLQDLPRLRPGHCATEQNYYSTFVCHVAGDVCA